MPNLAFIGFTVGSILAGAAGAHAVQTPKAWSHDWNGYGARVADRAAFVTVQLTVRGGVGRLYGWREDSAACTRERLLRCSVHRTFTGFDRRGVRRANVPLLVGVAVSSASSIAWRPERHNPQTAIEFAGTRALATLGVVVAERIVVDWLDSRRR